MPRKQMTKGQARKTRLQVLASRVAALEHDAALLSLSEQLRQALRRIAAIEGK